MAEHENVQGCRRRIKMDPSASDTLNVETIGNVEDTPEDEDPVFKENKPNLPLFKYISAELTRGYYLEHDEAKYTQKRDRVYAFLNIPKEMEVLMTYGFFLCMDAFLFLFTFLPLRVLLAFYTVLTRPCTVTSGGRILQPAQICDIFKMLILIVCSYLMCFLDFSMLYHIVRGQAVIKLYIIYNMLEVADRLFSSFGQDILDALFWTATEPRNKKREHIGIVPHLLLAIVYVFGHSVLILFQATTLNVAFNSHNKALLTIMMSNNFVELKGSVFKKFGKHNLYQMSCSDVRERYHYCVLLSIVVLRNMTELNWNFDHLWELMPDVVTVLVAEVIVDWVKHAFITKFNEIPADVYQEYRASLAQDMVSSRQKDAFSDHSDLVSRRMGFVPLPLSCLLFRTVWQSIKLPQNTVSAVIIILCYLTLTSFKVLTSIVLFGKACEYVKYAKKKAPQQRKKADYVRSKSFSGLPTKPETAVQTSESVSLYSKESLQSNSSVSLQSLGKDENAIIQQNVLPEKQAGESEGDKSKKSLSEIDRYTLCSSHIV
ncbi:transmembrane anterior posterior transformation protein 1 homolog [Ptychodera flava]|uniref:transmembrane anterior posterior transformation protein 1 homolog n=1 Tax=Ptychodera flava TaxID=63121 RepID=UPI00396AA8C0